MAPTHGKGKEADPQTATYEKKAEIINRSKNQNNYTRPSLGKCFRCGQPGHLSNSCPQRKTIVLAEEEGNLPGEDESEPGEETEEIEADERDRISCVIHKVHIAPKEEKNPQRHSLFKTRCTINGKVCNVIIDGGSSENFIAKKIVPNLNLKVEPHPNPYKIGWVKKGNESTVNEICTVPLSIGSSYKDQIVCDVIDMDVCHVLLGRPWQHDTQTLHKGIENDVIQSWN